MNYIDITQSNRLLFESLESLTNQIELTGDILTELKIKKERVREQINTNLELMDEYWKVTSASHRKLTVVKEGKTPTELQEMVIEAYLNRPDIPQYKIALELNIKQSKVSSILTDYLTHKFKEKTA